MYNMKNRHLDQISVYDDNGFLKNNAERNTWHRSTKNKAAWKVLLELREILEVPQDESILEYARKLMSNLHASQPHKQ